MNVYAQPIRIILLMLKMRELIADNLQLELRIFITSEYHYFGSRKNV